ncbi:ThuA domain-containing protein [Paenibacillus brevis]|uniref:ThuA domain-containing protein n=1 Tax=Paenibacillus brevis TaxID=2841508 RepID=A0ABS6FNW7_9BACL|nr:ThuA domain-containing protein [Paenibacillus brevis]MBU5671674.1 ThuA domain-containing protein [Paenibacillus brevis]
MSSIRVTVWNEFQHEKNNERVRAIYPEGIHATIATFLNAEEGISARTAVLDEPEHGLTEALLQETDVLIWWGHVAHGDVADEIVERVRQRVLEGMGLIVLHSGHASKIFRALMGTNTGSLKWRDDGEKERVWVIESAHPIAAGLGEYFEIPKEEMYGERFEIPAPDELVFISWFEGGEVFRSGCCYKRGLGKVFYFRPGHETFPVYHQAEVQRVIINGVRWAVKGEGAKVSYGRVAPLESVR